MIGLRVRGLGFVTWRDEARVRQPIPARTELCLRKIVYNYEVVKLPEKDVEQVAFVRPKVICDRAGARRRSCSKRLLMTDARDSSPKSSLSASSEQEGRKVPRKPDSMPGHVRDAALDK